MEARKRTVGNELLLSCDWLLDDTRLSGKTEAWSQPSFPVRLTRARSAWRTTSSLHTNVPSTHRALSKWKLGFLEFFTSKQFWGVHINTGSGFSIECVPANTTHQSKPYMRIITALGYAQPLRKGRKSLQLDPDQALFHSNTEEGWRKPYIVNPVVDKNGYFPLNGSF